MNWFKHLLSERETINPFLGVSGLILRSAFGVRALLGCGTFPDLLSRVAWARYFPTPWWEEVGGRLLSSVFWDGYHQSPCFPVVLTGLAQAS